MPKVPANLESEIVRLSKKYNDMLCSSCPIPVYQVVDNIGSTWLGRAKWYLSRPENTLIEFQKRILPHSKTFERVFAHEWIHHVNYMNLTPNDYAYIKRGIKRDGHGTEFLKLAAIVNDKMGKDFVTVRSDEDIVVAESGKKLQLLIYKLPNDRYGWAYAQKIGGKAREWLNRRMPTATNMRLTEVKEDVWAQGAKIGSGSYAIAQEPELHRKLGVLYDAAPAFVPPSTFGLLP